jgi:hypothetical protein
VDPPDPGRTRHPSLSSLYIFIYTPCSLPPTTRDHFLLRTRHFTLLYCYNVSTHPNRHSPSLQTSPSRLSNIHCIMPLHRLPLHHNNHPTPLLPLCPNLPMQLLNLHKERVLDDLPAAHLYHVPQGEDGRLHCEHFALRKGKVRLIEIEIHVWSESTTGALLLWEVRSELFGEECGAGILR